MSVMKKRKYNDDYIKYGFASVQKNGVDQQQCVICYEVLSNDSMRPPHLERHLWAKRGALKEKLKEFFAAKCDNLKRMKLDTAGTFAQTSEKVLEASLFGILEEARFQNDFKDTDTKSKISNHLQHLIDEFERYFPNSRDDKIYYRLSTDPFHVDVDVLPDRLQEEVLEIKNDSAAKYDFEKMDKPLFWVKYLTVYPSTAEQALKPYLPF
ncbi:SCAN domain-containing protein 3-like [Schistocerca piceifrons]|uniref:SCAN domain-containing protein 3-like n=1 Tax=Schistocerca piceifrons TaxID=274613 RepID=UPI001F5F1BED|nr:SCAN domain-containing protein 3-like [Schistocerca piceifrons]